MLTIIDNEVKGSFPESLSYIKGRKVLGRLVLPFTRWYRCINAQKYMIPVQRHLDIGCGDGYFLKRIHVRERYGLDKLLGDTINDRLPFSNGYFDSVSMLAVLEHLHKPQLLMKDIARVLKPKGRLIMTTPRRMTDKITRLYAQELDEEHVGYYNLHSIQDLTKDYFNLIDYHTFIFGLNQAFCLEKKSGDPS